MLTLHELHFQILNVMCIEVPCFWDSYHDMLLLQAGTPQRGYRERSPSLAMSPQTSAPVVLPPEEPNLPKIRVVVRKRPLNRKVIAPTATSGMNETIFMLHKAWPQ